MNNLDNIYNEALDMLKKGHSKEEVLLKFASVADELAPLLEISSSLLSMPRNIVPTPLMQRRYAVATVKNFWLTWLHISKFAGVSVSVLLLVSAVSVMGYQASKASPGQTLFAVRKQAEKLKLILATNQDAKADLQIKIAQSRLDQAQAIFNDPNSNLDEKKAALSELSFQTTSAIAQVSTVTKIDPTSEKSPPLLSVLDSITKKQQTLLETIKPDRQINTDTDSAIQALNANTVAISQIKQSVVAATNSQILASLSSQPNAVIVYGQITQVSKDQLTVEKLVFFFGGQTIIKDADGNNLSIESLHIGLKANVVGVKNQNSLLAQQILVSPKLTPPVAAGSSTTTPGTLTGQTTTPTSLKKIEVDVIAQPALQESGEGTASGLYIYESPEPQYNVK